MRAEVADPVKPRKPAAGAPRRAVAGADAAAAAAVQPRSAQASEQQGDRDEQGDPLQDRQGDHRGSLGPAHKAPASGAERPRARAREPPCREGSPRGRAGGVGPLAGVKRMASNPAGSRAAGGGDDGGGGKAGAPKRARAAHVWSSSSESSLSGGGAVVRAAGGAEGPAAGLPPVAAAAPVAVQGAAKTKQPRRQPKQAGAGAVKVEAVKAEAGGRGTPSGSVLGLGPQQPAPEQLRSAGQYQPPAAVRGGGGRAASSAQAQRLAQVQYLSAGAQYGRPLGELDLALYTSFRHAPLHQRVPPNRP